MRPVGELQRIFRRSLDHIRNHLVANEDVSDQLSEPLLTLSDLGSPRAGVLDSHAPGAPECEGGQLLLLSQHLLGRSQQLWRHSAGVTSTNYDIRVSVVVEGSLVVDSDDIIHIIVVDIVARRIVTWSVVG